MRPAAFLALLLTLPVAAIAAPPPSNPNAMVDRMESLERNVQLLQRQAARGGYSPQAAGGGVSGGAVGNAELSARFAEIDEQLRQIRGQIEESNHNSRRVAEDLAKYRQDMDMRMQDLESRTGPATPPVIGEDLATPAPDASADMTTPPPASAETAAPAATQEFASAREHYNYAFKMLNDRNYDQSTPLFEQFITKYPKDDLVGNVYYWMGETYYVKKDYPKAAEQFRKGFEAMPKGAKAPDNLLKLSMSLAAMKRTPDACVVLKQLLDKYKTSPGITAKATGEQKRLGCGA